MDVGLIKNYMNCYSYSYLHILITVDIDNSGV